MDPVFIIILLSIVLFVSIFIFRKPTVKPKPKDTDEPEPDSSDAGSSGGSDTGSSGGSDTGSSGGSSGGSLDPVKYTDTVCVDPQRFDTSQTCQTPGAECIGLPNDFKYTWQGTPLACTKTTTCLDGYTTFGNPPRCVPTCESTEKFSIYGYCRTKNDACVGPVGNPFKHTWQDGENGLLECKLKPGPAECVDGNFTPFGNPLRCVQVCETTKRYDTSGVCQTPNELCNQPSDNQFKFTWQGTSLLACAQKSGPECWNGVYSEGESKCVIPGATCTPGTEQKVSFASTYKYNSEGECIVNTCQTNYNKVGNECIIDPKTCTVDNTNYVRSTKNNTCEYANDPLRCVAGYGLDVADEKTCREFGTACEVVGVNDNFSRKWNEQGSYNAQCLKETPDTCKPDFLLQSGACLGAGSSCNPGRGNYKKGIVNEDGSACVEQTECIDNYYKETNGSCLAPGEDCVLIPADGNFMGVVSQTGGTCVKDPNKCVSNYGLLNSACVSIGASCGTDATSGKKMTYAAVGENAVCTIQEECTLVGAEIYNNKCHTNGQVCDKMTPKDANGTYKYSTTDNDCVLDSCTSPFDVDGTSCKVPAGISCVPTDNPGLSDGFAYTLNENNECSVKGTTCREGYGLYTNPVTSAKSCVADDSDCLNPGDGYDYKWKVTNGVAACTKQTTCETGITPYGPGTTKKCYLDADECDSTALTTDDIEPGATKYEYEYVGNTCNVSACGTIYDFNSIRKTCTPNPSKCPRPDPDDHFAFDIIDGECEISSTRCIDTHGLSGGSCKKFGDLCDTDSASPYESKWTRNQDGSASCTKQTTCKTGITPYGPIGDQKCYLNNDACQPITPVTNGSTYKYNSTTQTCDLSKCATNYKLNQAETGCVADPSQCRPDRTDNFTWTINNVGQCATGPCAVGYNATEGGQQCVQLGSDCSITTPQSGFKYTWQGTDVPVCTRAGCKDDYASYNSSCYTNNDACVPTLNDTVSGATYTFNKDANPPACVAACSGTASVKTPKDGTTKFCGTDCTTSGGFGGGTSTAGCVRINDTCTTGYTLVGTECVKDCSVSGTGLKGTQYYGSDTCTSIQDSTTCFDSSATLYNRKCYSSGATCTPTEADTVTDATSYTFNKDADPKCVATCPDGTAKKTDSTGAFCGSDCSVTGTGLKGTQKYGTTTCTPILPQTCFDSSAKLYNGQCYTNTPVKPSCTPTLADTVTDATDYKFDYATGRCNPTGCTDDPWGRGHKLLYDSSTRQCKYAEPRRCTDPLKIIYSSNDNKCDYPKPYTWGWAELSNQDEPESWTFTSAERCEAVVQGWVARGNNVTSWTWRQSPQWVTTPQGTYMNDGNRWKPGSCIMNTYTQNPPTSKFHSESHLSVLTVDNISACVNRTKSFPNCV